MKNTLIVGVVGLILGSVGISVQYANPPVETTIFQSSDQDSEPYWN